MGADALPLDRVKAAYIAANELRLMLAPFNEGHPAPGLSVGRFTLNELDNQIVAAHAALTNCIPSTTIVALVTAGTNTVAAGATRSLTSRATYADLSAAFLTSTPFT